MWFCISVPLVFVGAFFGFKQTLSDPPVRTNEIPRQVPAQAWYMGPHFTMLIGGILPFGAVFIELFFIMSSVWLQRFYYVFGFLALVLTILIITCAEISVVLCYFQLCNEDHLWMWHAFLNSGSAGMYLFGSSVLAKVRRASQSPQRAATLSQVQLRKTANAAAGQREYGGGVLPPRARLWGGVYILAPTPAPCRPSWSNEALF